jgi:hypothetical protein
MSTIKQLTDRARSIGVGIKFDAEWNDEPGWHFGPYILTDLPSGGCHIWCGMPKEAVAAALDALEAEEEDHPSPSSQWETFTDTFQRMSFWSNPKYRKAWWWCDD